MSKAKQTIFAHHALTPAGWLADQYVSVDAGHIQGLSSTGRADREADYLVFGMADVHNHGGMGFDASHPTPEGLAQWTWSLAQHGVTDVLITLATGDAQGVQAALSQIAAAMEKQREGKLPGAQIMGVHLEGPFISPKRPGAMNVTMIQPPSVAAYDALVGDDGALVRLVSLAPEVSGADALIDALNLRGIRVQAGHTDASYEEGVHAFGRGVGAVCHFFNAARSIHHRDPGLLTAALLSPSIYCELICDTIHIHPAALRLVIQAKGAQHAVIVSDAVVATGMPDGPYISANHCVVVKNGVSRTRGGALAGGSIYVSQGVANLIAAGIPSADAYVMATQSAAAWMGWQAHGTIAPGKVAHLAAVGGDWRPQWSLIGETYYQAEEKTK